MARVDDQSSRADQEILFDLTMKKQWKKVEEVYRHGLNFLTAKLTKSEDTGLHIAISSYRHGGQRDDVSRNKELERHVRYVISLSPTVLASQNVKGDTPLHLAAAIGWTEICDGIASEERSDLISIRNRNGETPLFVAAYHGQLDAFLCLHYHCYEKNKQGQEQPADYPLCRSLKDGNTILHSAISGEYFDLAFQIINKFNKTLINMKNVHGETPLHILARMPDVFRSSRHLNLYDDIIYRFAPVEELEERRYTPPPRPASGSNNVPTKDPKVTCSCPGNYQTFANLFIFFWTPFNSVIVAGKKTRASDEESQQQRDKKHEREQRRNGHFYPRNYENTLLLFKFGIKIILVVLGFGYHKIKDIQEKRKWDACALEIMNKLVDAETQYKYDYTGQRPTDQFRPLLSGAFSLPSVPPPDAAELDAKQYIETNSFSANRDPHENQSEENKTDKEYESTPILEAAKWGVPEIVGKILQKCPMAIHGLDTDGKNLLMVAAENRQISVFEKLLENEMLQEYLFHQVDKDENGILHLAARLEEGAEHWDIPGFVLQMQGEIKWYKYVKAKVPQMSFARPNIHGHTPKKIFADTHGWLMKEAADWMKTTSDSCSVIAALVASVGFATSASIPGGPNQDTGYPILKHQRMFIVFTVTSFIALSLSVTALVLFLSIITSRFQKRDFKEALPRRLLMGLTSLFVSIALMLVSFCAGHSFIMENKVKVGGMPIYLLATIPVMLFALAQMPLYLDLWHAMHRSVLRRSYKHGAPSRCEHSQNGRSETGKAASEQLGTSQPSLPKSMGRLRRAPEFPAVM